MRNVILLCSLVFTITLAILVANRLSNEAMAVATGALCGMSASLPVSLALFIALGRNGRHPAFESGIAAHHNTSPYPTSQPPVIVVAPPQMATTPYGYPPPSLYLPSSNGSGMHHEREFKIVGED